MKYSVISLLLLFSIATANADSIKKGTEADIPMLLDAASGVNSAYWASYIGSTQGRIYIVYESVVHGSSLFTKDTNRVVYWYSENTLSKEVLSKFIAYKKDNLYLD